MSAPKVLLKPGQVSNADIDGIIYVAGLNKAPEPILSTLNKAKSLDNAFGSNVNIIAVNLPAQRLIFSPVSFQSEYDDIRRYSEAAVNGVKRALAAGVKSPLLLLPSSDTDEETGLVTLLGALEALYVPIQLREDVPSRAVKANSLQLAYDNGRDVSDLITIATILEEGRTIARDIGGGDPERMAPPKVQEYVENIFRGADNIKIEVLDKEEDFLRDYPLFAAVNRAASVIERHQGRIMYLRYEPTGTITKSLYLVGKGITYDTGGIDIKTDGKMLGMSRDKCGAAAVAGFMKVVSELKPLNMRVVGALCLARNSVGENGYVSDEVLTARSGARVRVMNTDAEGRMVMADVLCKLKEEAVNVENAQLLTIATLTGHAVLTAGPYSIAMDNTVAKSAKNASTLQAAGEALGDAFEISILRREDFANHAGCQEGDDVQQSRSLPSSRCPRGHQGPAAFLIVTSGLNKHESKSEKPLKYSHLDIAGSAGDPPAEATGAPILALYGSYLRSN